MTALTTEQIALAVNNLAEKVGLDVKFLKENKAAKTKYAGSGVNILSEYLQVFAGYATADFYKLNTMAAYVNPEVKHIRKQGLSLTSDGTANTAACIFFDVSDSTYDNIKLTGGAKYIYSFYAKCSTTGKQFKPVLKTSDGTVFTTETDPLILTDQMVRYSMVFTAPLAATGAVIGFYTNLDNELTNTFYLEGLMLEKVIFEDVTPIVPSDFAD